MSSRKIRDQAVEQFTRHAADYAVSKSHAAGRSLQLLLDHMPLDCGALMLDVATGAGHTALAFAGSGARAVALDPAIGMLEAAPEHRAALQAVEDRDDLRFWIHKCLLVGRR